MKYYFVGIKGSGMSALASILKDLGNEVWGVDVDDELFTQKKLINKDIKIESFSNFDYTDADIIVLGNSFLDKKEIFKNKEIVTYQEMLSIIMEKYYSIAICGTHGKTTTTNMIMQVLSSIDDVSYLIGDGSGKASKKSKYFIFEACEHKENFLNYYPDMIINTNVDYDHIDFYQSKRKYKESFHKFFNHAKDKLIINTSVNYKKDALTYGIKKGKIKASKIKYLEKGITFDLLIDNQKYENIFLPIYGSHMLENALACIACSTYLNVEVNDIINKLKEYKNATRRYEITYKNSNIVIDDYGHHPHAIEKTIDAIKQQFINKQIIVIYHPDRPKRITCFHHQFIKAFKKVSKAYILPFLNHKKEQENATISLIDNKKIYRFNESFYKKYEDTVFLFTGSKEMKNIIIRLLDFL